MTQLLTYLYKHTYKHTDFIKLFRLTRRVWLKMATLPSYDLAREATPDELARNYRDVCERVAHACANRASSHTRKEEVVNSNSNTNNKSDPSEDVTLVAISKTKSPSCVRAVYDCGHRVFGENYVHELVTKAALLPSDIQWHFVGHLQSNKVKDLVNGVANLAVVQTVDTIKLATKLEAAWAAQSSSSSTETSSTAGAPGLQSQTASRAARALSVYIQVNTSGEESKSGTEPGPSTVALARFITESCSHLRLSGLMTIGMPDYTSTPACFTRLVECRALVAEALQVPVTSLTLSMGMSGDFVQAIAMGSTSVRVGSAIFGERHYPAAK